jgi:cytochrome P450
MNFLMAATETSATALSWFFHEISRAPDLERQVHAEVDAMPVDRPPTREELGRLPTVDRVLNEVLRLYPPGWMMSRVVTEDSVLGGHALPAGSVVIYSTYALQRDPRLFTDPDRFDPDRWLPERSGEIAKGSMIPFGGGSRRCIGDAFATAEVTLGVIAIARRWRLRGTGATVEPLPRALTAMGPLPMITEPRPRTLIEPKERSPIRSGRGPAGCPARRS